MSGLIVFFVFFSSRRRHTRLQGDWSSDVCSSDLIGRIVAGRIWDLNRRRFRAFERTPELGGEDEGSQIGPTLRRDRGDSTPEGALVRSAPDSHFSRPHCAFIPLFQLA